MCPHGRCSSCSLAYRILTARNSTLAQTAGLQQKLFREHGASLVTTRFATFMVRPSDLMRKVPVLLKAAQVLSWFEVLGFRALGFGVQGVGLNSTLT